MSCAPGAGMSYTRSSIFLRTSHRPSAQGMLPGCSSRPRRANSPRHKTMTTAPATLPPPAPVTNEQERATWLQVRAAFLESKRGKSGSHETYQQYAGILAAFFGDFQEHSPLEGSRQEVEAFIVEPCSGLKNHGTPPSAALGYCKPFNSMSLKSLPIPPVPEETARVAHAVFPHGNVFMQVRDTASNHLHR